MPPARAAPPLGECLRLLLFIGSVSVGGGRAMIALVEREMVQRRRWLTPEEFADTYALAHVLPGVYSVNMGAILGYRWYGALGGIATVGALILPSFLLVLFMAQGYAALRDVPAVRQVFGAVGAAVVGMFLAVAVSIGRVIVRDAAGAAIVAAAALGFAALRVHPALMVVAAGAAGYLIYGRARR
ncbi:MAG: chromate transporter [Armatimonadetes bacterium]|nr:chromate transporter [Armatimonadota bacterium]